MPDTNELKQRAAEAVEAWASQLWQTSLAIHACPELGYAEHQAADQLCQLLEQGGIPVERGVAGMPTAFRAVVHGQSVRPAVAILAEMDALPEVGHGCGHNLIGTAAVGAGLALSALAGSGLAGSAVVLGCPAEESAVDGSGGKIRLLQAGAFADVDAAIMVHPGTQDLVSLDGSLAACGMEFEFTGKPAHAAAMPHEGINALDGVLQTFAGINALRQHVRPDVRIHGVITYGGASPNVVPARAVCRFRVRAEDRQYLDEVAEKVRNCARAGSLSSGASLTISETTPIYEEVRTDPAIARMLLQNLAALGRPVSHVPRHSGRGSTDFGNVSQVVPAASATVAIAQDTVAIHSQEFAAAAATEPARQMLLDSAKALAMTAIEIMAGPELLEPGRAGC